MEVAPFSKILSHFSPMVPPSAAGERWRRFRRGGHLVARVGMFYSLVLEVGGLMCQSQQHSVETFLLRILKDSRVGLNPQGLLYGVKKMT